MLSSYESNCLLLNHTFLTVNSYLQNLKNLQTLISSYFIQPFVWVNAVRNNSISVQSKSSALLTPYFTANVYTSKFKKSADDNCKVILFECFVWVNDVGNNIDCLLFNP